MTLTTRSAIDTFLSILRENWFQVQDLGRQVSGEMAADFVADWAQATWEMIVEASLDSQDGSVFLEPYGDGADCNEIGSRVWRPGVESTHAIHVVPLSGRDFHDRLTGTSFGSPEQGIALDQFVRLTEDGWFRPEPPFDHVLIYQDRNEKAVRMEEVRFLLVELPTQR